MAWGKWLGGKYFHALPFQRNQVTFQVKVPVPTAADVEIPKEMHFLFPSFFSTVLMAFFNALKENVFYNLDAETPPHLSSDTLCTLACLSFLGESSCVKRVLRDTAVHRWRVFPDNVLRSSQVGQHPHPFLRLQPCAITAPPDKERNTTE